MKNIVTIIITLIITITAKGQDEGTVKGISASERKFIANVFEHISRSDQTYRAPLSKGTLDTTILNNIDSVFDNHGVQAGLIYEQNLKLKLSESVKDSLWQLQHAIDFANHMTLRGIFQQYGWISEEQVKENNFVQILLLMHPPRDWDIPKYLVEYSSMLIQEVISGRMPAKIYAMFYDNVKAKMLREPQLYGTNQKFDATTKKILPPGISSLAESNRARKAIGLPELKEGEYRILPKEEVVTSSNK